MQGVETGLFRFTGARNWTDLAGTTIYANATRNVSSRSVFSRMLSLMRRLAKQESAHETTVTVTPHKVGEGGAFVPEGPGISYSGLIVEDIGRGVLQALKADCGT